MCFWEFPIRLINLMPIHCGNSGLNCSPFKQREFLVKIARARTTDGLGAFFHLTVISAGLSMKLFCQAPVCSVVGGAQLEDSQLVPELNHKEFKSCSCDHWMLEPSSVMIFLFFCVFFFLMLQFIAS